MGGFSGSGGGGATDHGALTGLADDDHAIYALLAGRAGGQTIIGDTASAGVLELAGTSHATKGPVRVQTDSPFEIPEFTVAPGTPASGYGRLYVKTDGAIYFKNDTGVETNLTTVGGASALADLSDVTSPLTGVRGDLFYRDASAWNRLPVGAANEVVITDGTDPSWGAVANAHVDAAAAIALTKLAALTVDRAVQTNGAGVLEVSAVTAAELAFLDGVTSAIQTQLDGKSATTHDHDADYEALDAGLTSIAGLTTAADRMIYTTALDTYAVSTLSSFARTILDDADAAAVRTTIDAAESGHDHAGVYQPLDTDLTALAAIAGVNGDVIVRAGGAWARLAVGSNDQVLKVVTGAPAWAAEAGATQFTDLSDVSFGAVARGDILRRGVTNWNNLAVGAANTVFQTDGVDPSWSSVNNAHVDAAAAIALSKLASLTVSRALQSSATGIIEVSAVTAAELAFLDGVTSALQTQLDGKSATTHDHDADYEALDAGLTSIAGLTTAADRMIYTTALDTYAVATLSSFARTILDDADAAAVKTTLGLTIGTDVQAYDADLDALAAIAGVNGDIIVRTGGAWARLAVGSNGEVLTVSTGAPAWAAAGGGTSHDLDSATHTDVAAQANVRGDLLLMNATPEWDRLAVGAANEVLVSDGTDPSWAALTNTYIDAAAAIAVSKLAALTASRAVQTSGTGVLEPSAVTAAELAFLDGVTSALQTQLDGKSATTHDHDADYQALDTGLTSIAGLTTAADRMIYTTALDTYAVATLSSFARTILDDADAAAVRTTISAAETSHTHSGVYQPLDSDLTAIAGIAGVNGDIIVRTGGAWARLAIGANGEVLKVTTGAPAWEAEGGGTSHALDSATHTDVAAQANVRGDLLLMNATPEWDRLAVGAANAVLVSDGIDPSWAALTNTYIDAAAAIALTKLAALTADRAVQTSGTGVLEVSAVTAAELAYLDGVTSALQTQLDDKAASLHTHVTGDLTAGTLGLNRGGLGFATISQYSLIYGDATDSLAELAAGAEGSFLKISASTPTWAALAAGDIASGTLGVARGGTGVSTLTGAGRLLYASGATTLATLAPGTAGQQLKMNSGTTAPEWTDDILVGCVTFGNGTDVIAAGQATFWVGHACTLTKVELISVDSTSGSATVDLWKDNYAGGPAVVGDSMVGGSGTKPNITSGTKGQDTSFTSWASTTLVAGDHVTLNLEAGATTLKRLAVAVFAKKTG